jgi:hypothetical protein
VSETTDDKPDFDSWAILELMGHVRMAGRVTEEERFGAKMGRIDVPTSPVRTCNNCDGSGDQAPPNPADLPCPICGGKGTLGGGFTTVYFTAASVYRMTPCTEDLARAVAARSQPEPVHRYELPAPKTERARTLYDPEGDDDRDRSYYDRDEPD